MLRNWSLNPLAKVAIGILRKYGADAHVYLPGIGTVNGLTAGNYLDSAGTTAATVDNPVGLSLDALQAMTLGPELVANGSNLVTTTGWTATALSGAPASLSVSGGSLMVTNTGDTYGVAAQTVPVTSGLTYQISALLTKGTAVAANIRVGSTALGYEYTDQAATGIAVPITATFKATSSNVFISLLNTNTTDGTCIYGKISVREIPGIHASQATTANKPILRRGLLNQLTYSQDASNTSWVKSTATATPGKLIEATGSAQHYMAQSIDMPDGPVTFAAIFAPAERSWSTMYLGSVNSSVWFNSSTGVIGTTGASITASIASLANGYKLCVITGIQTGLGAITRGLYIADADNSNTYTGDGTSGILFGGAGLFQGTYTAQQILDAGGIPLTTTAAASNPSAGKYSWQFDGSNDSLLTAITTGDVGWLCAGVTFTDSNSTLFCSGAGSAVQKGIWTYRVAASDAFVTLIGNGTAPTSPASIAAPAGQPLVIASGWDASNIFHSVNSTETTASRTGSASPSPSTLRIGAYTDGTTYPLGGNMNIALVFSVLPTADERLTLKRFVGQLSGVSGI